MNDEVEVSALYSVRTNSRGRDMYYKNGKLVSKRDIPEDAAVLDRDMLDMADLMVDPTEAKSATVEEDLQPEKVSPSCIWGDGVGNFVRFINLQYVNLCEYHYHNATTGEVVQVMRNHDNGNGTPETNPEESDR